VSQQGDEVQGVWAAPAGDWVPAGSGGVAGEDTGGPEHRVVAGDYVVEGPVVGGAAGDVVDGGVDEAQVLAACWSARAMMAAHRGWRRWCLRLAGGRRR